MINIGIGTRFTSSTFMMKAKIIAIDKEAATVDVELSYSDGTAWIEKGWNLHHVRWAFQENIYKAIHDPVDEALQKKIDKSYNNFI